VPILEPIIGSLFITSAAGRANNSETAAPIGPKIFVDTLPVALINVAKKIRQIRTRIRIFPEKSGFQKWLAGSGSICLCVIYICQTPSTPLKKSGSGRRVAGKPAKPPSLDMKINSTLILPFSFSNFLSLVWMKTFKNVTVHRYCDLSIL
jgi:hypothetical protein